MTLKSDRRDLSFEEITDIARNLPTKQQLELAEELQRAGLKAKWDEIFAALKPNSISNHEIVCICKEVRRERYQKRLGEEAARRR